MKVRLRMRQPFSGLAIAGALGVVLADCWRVELMPILIFVAGFAVAALVLRRTALNLLLVAAVFFALHTLDHYEAPGRRLDHVVGTGPAAVRGTGIVVGEPRLIANDRGGVSRFTLRLRELRTGSQTVTIPAKANMVWRGGSPDYGDLIEFAGAASRSAAPRNPGEFDYAGLLQRQGIYCEIEVAYPKDARVIGHGFGNPFVAWVLDARGWMQWALTLDLEDAPEVAGLVQSMVLGLKRETAEELRDVFSKTGTLHVFVVSGLHVGLVSLLAIGLLRTAGLGRRASVAILIPLLWLYALVTGLSAGSVRATLTATIVLGGYALERPAVTANSFAAAFFIALLWRTEQLFMPGFQFSFAVVFSILLIAPPLQRWFRRKGSPDPFLPRLLWEPWQHARNGAARVAAGLLAVSIAAWIGSLLFMARYFHLISPSAILANLVVVPTAFLILGHGMLSIVSAAISDSLAVVFNNANFAVVQVLLATVHFFAGVPGGYRYVELPHRGARAPVEVTVLDLGAGGATHVRSGGEDWLIDCGQNWTYGNIVRPYLRMRGVNRLAGLFLTHGDAGHLGAAPRAIADFVPGFVGESAVKDRSLNRRALRSFLADAGRGKSILDRGDFLFAPGGRVWRVLYPPAGLEVRSADDKALVLQFEAGVHRILFMSDSGFMTEEWLLAHKTGLRSDVLVKGSHRADFSGSLGFMTAVAPAVVVLGRVGPSETGRLPDGWAEEMRRRGVRVFDQRHCGAVKVSLFADGVTAETFLGDQTFSNRVR